MVTVILFPVRGAVREDPAKLHRVLWMESSRVSFLLGREQHRISDQAHLFRMFLMLSFFFFFKELHVFELLVM